MSIEAWLGGIAIFAGLMSLPIAFVLAKKGLIKSCDGYGKGLA